MRLGKKLITETLPAQLAEKGMLGALENYETLSEDQFVADYRKIPGIDRDAKRILTEAAKGLKDNANFWRKGSKHVMKRYRMGINSRMKTDNKLFKTAGKHLRVAERAHRKAQLRYSNAVDKFVRKMSRALEKAVAR